MQPIYMAKHQQTADRIEELLSDEDGAKAIGNRIRFRREYLGLGQADVAARFGRTRGWATSIENGVNTISGPDLIRMGIVLRCPPGYLLGDEVSPDEMEEVELLTLWRLVPSEARPMFMAALRGVVVAVVDRPGWRRQSSSKKEKVSRLAFEAKTEYA